MTVDPHHRELFRHLEQGFQQDFFPSEIDFQALLQAAQSANATVQERALVLLLHPPVADQPGYHRRLLHRAGKWVREGVPLPPAVWEWVLEWLVFLHAGSGVAGEQEAFFCKKVPVSVWRRFSRKPLAAGLFLRHWDSLGFLEPKRSARRLIKRRWRLLRRKLRVGEADETWAELTLQDFSSFRRTPGLSRRLKTGQGRWLRVARALTARSGQRDGTSFGSKGSIARVETAYWGGFGNGALGYLQALLQLQANELREIRRFARAASHFSRRVVVSFHNATLAAMGGWAFESLDRQFPNQQTWRQFKRDVLARADRLNRCAPTLDEPLIRLWGLWESRLVEPKRTQAGWEDSLRRDMIEDPVKQASGRGCGDYPARSRDAWCDPPSASKFGWSGPLQPCQHPDPAAIESWRKQRLRLWGPGMRRFRVMVEVGNEMLAKGEIAQLVLPWIDKFFISSLRDQDTEYLPGIMDWLQDPGANPLVLFWEDSGRRRQASFALTLAKIKRQDWRGVGMFGPAAGDRREALEIIRREHARIGLFALRPVSEQHNPAALEELLLDRPRHFLSRYDSSWKDGQVALYTGTQVFPLVSVQCDPEALPCWMVCRGICWPVGAFVRAWLRRAVLGANEAGPATDPLAWDYQRWAALG